MKKIGFKEKSFFLEYEIKLSKLDQFIGNTYFHQFGEPLSLHLYH